jgi:integrase
MPLELRKTKNGSVQPNWYGRFKIDGKRHCVTLGKIEGEPPSSLSLKDVGDKTFEKSRQRAQETLAVKIEQAREKRNAGHWVKKLHEIQHGEAMQSCPVSGLISAWERMPRRKPLSELHPRYVTDVRATIRRFIEHIQAEHPTAKEADQITRSMAGEFIAAEEARGISAKARNDSLKRLRALFQSLLNEDLVSNSPFAGIPLHSENHIHRRPLSESEIERLLNAVESDDFTRPLILCALSTAMRLGDCCVLKWESVHLDEGSRVADHITLTTGKTGETITAPVDARLKSELLRAKRTSEYVWPEQARMIQENPQGVSYRIKKAFTNAGFKDEERHQKRKRGKRPASVIDFHSLRTTWITEKLAAGVPIEAVRRTSGHRTTDVVTEHYFRPDDQTHLETLSGKVSGAARDERLREVIANMKARTWKADRERLLEILDKGQVSA